MTLLARVSDRTLLIAVLFAAVGSASLIFWGSGDGLMASGFAAMTLVLAALLQVFRTLYPPVASAQVDFDWALVREAADNGNVAVAVTDRMGRLVCANALHESWFSGPTAPPALGLSDADTAALTQAGRVAWRDGRFLLRGLRRDLMTFDAEVMRGGRNEDHLVWRFNAANAIDLAAEAKRLIEGPAGVRIGEAGIMAVMIGAEGRVRSASRSLLSAKSWPSTPANPLRPPRSLA
jgi:two-component system cell cycle sensor histidine kinase/response regulator CckA